MEYSIENARAVAACATSVNGKTRVKKHHGEDLTNVYASHGGFNEGFVSRTILVMSSKFCMIKTYVKLQTVMNTQEIKENSF